MRTPHVVHVITGLELGGAESLLARIVSRPGASFRHTVVSMTTAGPLARPILEAGVPVHALGLRRGRPPGPAGLARLTLLLRRCRPDVVQTWLYQADLAGAVATRLALCPAPVVWGVHHTNLDASRDKRLTILTASACARVSGILPARVICCAESTRQAHLAAGYRDDRLVVVDNGIDTDLFAPDPVARREIRTALGLDDHHLLVGRVARHHPQKDTPTLLAALSTVANARPQTHLLLAGPGFEPDAPEARRMLDVHTGLASRVHLLGARRDPERVYAALDVYVSSSVGGEASPLSLAEALATEVPCVTTDVGDSRRLVETSGRTVPPRQPDLLASAIAELLDMPAPLRHEMGRTGRMRAVHSMSLAACVAGYEAVWSDVVSNGRPARAAA